MFGDVNELQLKHLLPWVQHNKKVLLYPHEIKIDRNSALKVKVQNSYFKGPNYLIKAYLNKEAVYFEHSSEIQSGKEVAIGIKAKTIASRFHQ